MRYAMFILYVRHQAVSREFYRQVLLLEPVLDVPGMTEFQLNDGAILGLMPEEGIARIICAPPDGDAALDNALRHPRIAGGVPRCELYLPSDEPSAALERATAAGGRIVSPAQMRSWGDIAGYCSDPDGHVIAFACKAG